MFSCENCKISKSPHFEEHLTAYDCFWSDFRKGLYRAFFLDSRFQNHPNLVILQKNQPFSNHGFNPFMTETVII